MRDLRDEQADRRTPDPAPWSRRVAALAGAALVVVAAAFATGPAAHAAAAAPRRAPQATDPTTSTTSPAVTLRSVSAWVLSDGTFRVRLQPAATVAADAVLRYSIRQRLRPAGRQSTRTTVASVIADGGDTRSLQGPTEVPLASLPVGAEGLELDIPIRSGPGDADRVLVPNPGIHPVELDLRDATGEELWRTTVFLNRLPTEPPVGRDGRAAVTAVQLVAGIESGPSLAADGSVQIEPSDRAAISAMESLLSGAVDLPLTVAVRPNTLAALRMSPDPADERLLQQLGTSRWTLTRSAYARVDAAALVATGTEELQRQVAAGDAVTAAYASATDRSLWVLDDTVGTTAATGLASVGVEYLLTSPDRLEATSRNLADDAVTTRTFALEGVEGTRVAAYDTELTVQLLESEVEPALRAHRATALVMADWFEAVESGPEPFPGMSAAVVLPPGIDGETLDAFTAPLLTDGPLRASAPPPPSHDADGTFRAAVVATPTEDLDAVVRRTTSVGRLVDGYRSMAPADTATAASWDLVNDQAPSIGATAAQRSSYADAVEAGIAAQVALIEPPRSRTVVLTSRQGAIPLRFRNGLGTEVRLRMSLRSARLEFPDGETTEIVLAPGENRIDVPVIVQAAGSSQLRIELASPDTTLAVGEATLSVRSSSISGVGAVLSLLSLAFLGWWWLTHRRRRRTGPTDTPTTDSVIEGGEHDGARPAGQQH